MQIKTSTGWVELGSSVTQYGGPKTSVSEGHCFHWLNAVKRGDVSEVRHVSNARKHQAIETAKFMVVTYHKLIAKAHPVGLSAHTAVCETDNGSHCEQHCPLVSAMRRYEGFLAAHSSTETREAA